MNHFRKLINMFIAFLISVLGTINVFACKKKTAIDPENEPKTKTETEREKDSDSFKNFDPSRMKCMYGIPDVQFVPIKNEAPSQEESSARDGEKSKEEKSSKGNDQESK